MTAIASARPQEWPARARCWGNGDCLGAVPDTWATPRLLERSTVCPGALTFGRAGPPRRGASGTLLGEGSDGHGGGSHDAQRNGVEAEAVGRQRAEVAQVLDD